MDWKWVLFSFSGRITRMYWWLGGVILAAVSLVYYGIFLMVAGPTAFATGDISALAWILIFLAIPLYVLLIWSGLAVSIKRWHDRGKSGWWVLIGFVPLIGGIWQLVECGFLSGTPGVNQYGTENQPPADPFSK